MSVFVIFGLGAWFFGEQRPLRDQETPAKCPGTSRTSRENLDERGVVTCECCGCPEFVLGFLGCFECCPRISQTYWEVCNCCHENYIAILPRGIDDLGTWHAFVVLKTAMFTLFLNYPDQGVPPNCGSVVFLKPCNPPLNVIYPL